MSRNKKPVNYTIDSDSDWEDDEDFSSLTIKGNKSKSSSTTTKKQITTKSSSKSKYVVDLSQSDDIDDIIAYTPKPASSRKKPIIDSTSDHERSDDYDNEDDEDYSDFSQEKPPSKKSRSSISKSSVMSSKVNDTAKSTAVTNKASKSSSSWSSSKNRKSSNNNMTIPDKSFSDNLVDVSPSKILHEIRTIRDEMRGRELSQEIAASEYIEDVHEVQDMESSEVMTHIENLVLDVVRQIISSNTFEYTIPSRNASNQQYIEAIDRIVLGNKTSKRQFLNTAHVRKTAITTRAIQLIHEVVAKGIHITKRDMFYTDVKLFQEQTESDAVLDDIACMIGCTRSSLHVVASDKGLVVGRIQYQEAGDEIDCTKMGIGGKAIPPYIDQISNIRSDADFIILVEKEAAYMRLAEDRFYHKYPCIIVTGKGQPDVATRLFLKKITTQLKIPVLALVDSDPYGLKIMSVYCSGSKQMSYDSGHLTTAEIKWLGIRPSDLDRYNLPAQCRLKLTDTDRKMGEELLKEPFIQKNAAWVAELQHMLDTGEKAEIQALSSFGFQYITEVYLPTKLHQGDWI